MTKLTIIQNVMSQALCLFRTIARRLSARNMDSADAHALGASGHVQAYRGKLIHVALD